MRIGQLDEEEAVAEVRQPERERRGDERQPEPVHRPVERAVELQSEPAAAVGEQRRVDDQRSCEVADDHAEGPLVEDDDQEDGRGDRYAHVRQRRRHVCGRPLLDAEQRGHLLVVHRRPEADEGGDDEAGVVVRPEQQPRDRARQRDPEHEHRRRGREHVPERRPDDEQPPLLLRRVEVEAEEGALHPLGDERRQHGRQRDERLDQPVVAGREVARVQGQQEDAEDARDDAPEPVDRGVAQQLLEPLDHQFKVWRRRSR